MSTQESEFETIGSRTIAELNRRLATPALAQDLPGTLLMKVAMDYVKHLEKKNEIEQAKLEGVKIDPLEVIDQEGLPMSMRLEILNEYLDDCEAYWVAASSKMVELLEEVKGGKTDVLPQVQEVVPED